MNELIEQPNKTDDISIKFTFVNGDLFEQPLTYNELEGVIDLMAWFKDPKGSPVWTWSVPSVQKVQMLHRKHIMSIEIIGFIEFDNHKTKWYQRRIDKVRIWLMSRRVYAKNINHKKADRDRSKSMPFNDGNGVL